jgi:hypothetical protein
MAVSFSSESGHRALTRISTTSGDTTSRSCLATTSMHLSLPALYSKLLDSAKFSPVIMAGLTARWARAAEV